MKKILKYIINGLLGFAGLMVIKNNNEVTRDSKKKKRPSMNGALMHVKKFGFTPNVVLDIGAALGTDPLLEIFPESNHFMVEALEEFIPKLEDVKQRMANASFLIAAVTSENGPITINVHPDLVGSSIYLEDEDSSVNGIPREVPAYKLDDLCSKYKLKGPYLLKIDVQGAELDVLKGAEKTLMDTEYVILEIAFFNFFNDGPKPHHYIDFMKRHGFVIYELFDLQYRPLDGAMSQVDIAFVKEDGIFRQQQHYATNEQREEQNKRLLSSISMQ